MAGKTQAMAGKTRGKKNIYREQVLIDKIFNKGTLLRDNGEALKSKIFRAIARKRQYNIVQLDRY